MSFWEQQISLKLIPLQCVWASDWRPDRSWFVSRSCRITCQNHLVVQRWVVRGRSWSLEHAEGFLGKGQTREKELKWKITRMEIQGLWYFWESDSLMRFHGIFKFSSKREEKDAVEAQSPSLDQAKPWQSSRESSKSTRFGLWLTDLGGKIRQETWKLLVVAPNGRSSWDE